ncbi:MAG: hypothetical protein HKO59_08885 [Phycisphaerales bacterium]|nr:hypothetical protein [Phycisphaerales bacterium]
MTRLGPLVLAAALLPLLAAAPAVASHDRPEPGSRSVYKHKKHKKRGGYDRHAQAQFDRGYVLGESRGFEAGFADAVDHRPFCDITPYYITKRSPRIFAEGFRAAYRDAYDRGFHAGQRNHVQRHNRWRRAQSRWWWRR